MKTDAFEVAIQEYIKTYSLEQLEAHLAEIRKREPAMKNEIAFFEKVVDRKKEMERDV